MSVGIALSWWEASEDILMGLFKWLCGQREPAAFEAYVATSRSARSRMLSSALERHKSRFLPEEIQVIRAAMRELDKFAPMRNQIAHGHVSQQQMTVDGKLTLDGVFLVPSLNEGGFNVERDQRYAHTASEIDEWRDKVREARGKVMDAKFAAAIREQQARLEYDTDAMKTLAIAEAIYEGKASPQQFSIVEKAPSSQPA